MVWYKEYANLLNESESKYSYMIVVKMYLVLSTTPVLLELIQVSHSTFNVLVFTICSIWVFLNLHGRLL